MAVMLNNGNTGDNAVGLVAVSSWQGWLNHTPNTRNQEPGPGYGVNNLARLYSTFTWSSPKSAFGYTKNGHTALLARRGGAIIQAVGFNPNSFFLAGLLQTLRGNDITVQGLWYDDAAMINDPTAISYEINVSAEQAQSFGQLIASLVGRSDLGPHSPTTSNYYYSFRPATTEATTDGLVGNCGNMALMILNQFLHEVGKSKYADMFLEWVNSNQNTRNFGQGPLMGAIGGGFA
ncbi:MAG TPA: hypothetical protein VHZ07_01420 [Bryobacteraceae bacterium]|jgi:hypothetical protein|nr:hypothetical protein [Bryobacteraceae bacterium]